MAKVIRTADEFVSEVQKVAERKGGLTPEQARWVLADKSIQQLCLIGFRINNTPAKVWEAITAGLVSAWVKHNMAAGTRQEETHGRISRRDLPYPAQRQEGEHGKGE